MSGAPRASKSEYHDSLKPLSWLLGKWESKNGQGYYPTLISDFKFEGETEFFAIGMKPLIEYKMYTSQLNSGTPMHRETGFIELNPQTNDVAVTSAHNVGVAQIQEGKLEGQKLTVETTQISRSSFNKPPVFTKLRRTLTGKGNQLELVMHLQTDQTPMTEHICVTFDKVV